MAFGDTQKALDAHQQSIAIVLPDDKRQVDAQLVIADLLRPTEFLIDGFGIKGFALP
ncbi:hypothetical protein D3C81_2192200 [compost metagenome]